MYNLIKTIFFLLQRQHSHREAGELASLMQPVRGRDCGGSGAHPVCDRARGGPGGHHLRPGPCPLRRHEDQQGAVGVRVPHCEGGAGGAQETKVI